MDIRFENIEEMSPSDRRKFLRAIAEDDVLRRDYATWLAISEHVRERQKNHIQDRSILVLAAMRRGGLEWALTSEDRRRLDDVWPEIFQAFSDTSFLDDVLGRIALEAADFDDSWKLRESHLRSLRPASASHRPRLARVMWRASAVAAVVVFIGILLFVLQRDASWVQVDVPGDEIRSIALVDGSTIRVVGPSTLGYLPSESATARPRLLRLSGDAFFDVVPSDEPFLVETSAARVSVLGTSFGVRSRRDRTDVVVATGSVSVLGRGGAGAVVTTGQSCFVVADQEPSAPVYVDLTEALAWTSLFVFRATPLAEIATILSQHYGVEVVVDPALSETAITGTFDSDRELGEILDVIARTATATVVETPTGYRLVADRQS